MDDSVAVVVPIVKYIVDRGCNEAETTGTPVSFLNFQWKYWIFTKQKFSWRKTNTGTFARAWQKSTSWNLQSIECRKKWHRKLESFTEQEYLQIFRSSKGKRIKKIVDRERIIFFLSVKSSQALIKDQPEDVARLETNFREKLTELGEVTNNLCAFNNDLNLMHLHSVKGDFQTRNCSSGFIDSIQWFNERPQRIVQSPTRIGFR